MYAPEVESWYIISEEHRRPNSAAANQPTNQPSSYQPTSCHNKPPAAACQQAASQPAAASSRTGQLSITANSPSMKTLNFNL